MEAAHNGVALVVELSGRRAEQRLGLGLRRRSEREEGYVRRHGAGGLHLREVGVHDVLVGRVVLAELEDDVEPELVRRGVERRPERGGAAALLGAVGLVDDDGEPRAGELGQRGDVRPGIEERLDGDDDDLAALAQGVYELVAF